MFFAVKLFVVKISFVLPVFLVAGQPTVPGELMIASLAVYRFSEGSFDV
jgi:hypothetical protein